MNLTASAASLDVRTPEASLARLRTAGRFLGVSVQLAVLVVLIRTFRIEEPFGFVAAAPVILVGFVVHAVLPLRLRQPFFVFLGMATAVVVFGPKYGSVLVGVGLGLIALCHLPVAFRLRIILLLGAAAGLAAARAELVPAPGAVATIVLPIVGAMFMFRLILYLYALPHERERVTVWQRLGYFFMLPNICFPLFPVVDWQTFRRTYFDRDEWEIYQKGLSWILRGITHILLYRVVYHHLLPSPTAVADLGGVVVYMLATYALYLRISGQFHIIIGILCLFGYNLPETHHLYFLASSFTDYWRRINIYWKDFMTKIFYYPTMMRARRWGMTTAVVVSTLVVFAATWLLHSYQWFWLRGTFPLTGPDALFWGVLAVLVVANSLHEMKKGRARKTGSGEWSLAAAVKLSARVVGMFVVICVLWSIWSSPSLAAWGRLVSQAGNSGASEWLLLALMLVGLVAAGVAFQYVQRRSAPARAVVHRPVFARSAAQTGVAAIALLGLASPGVQRQLGGPVGAFVASIQDERLNEDDEASMERGYYEGLLEAPRYTSGLWRVRSGQPADWVGIRETEYIHDRDDLLEFELLPDVKGVFKDVLFRTNRWGMRDRSYTLAKPAGTHRIALLGASYGMAEGVRYEDGFEAVLEERLNREWKGPFSGHEILNFSVGGYSVVQNEIVAREKAVAFEPDVILYTVHGTGTEAGRLALHVARIHEERRSLGVEALDDLLEEAGIWAGMSTGEMAERLSSRMDGFFRWSFSSIARTAREAGAVPAVVYVPGTSEEGGPSLETTRMLRIAEEAGFVTMAIDYVFVGRPWKEMVVASWDTHPNEAGHRLLADALYDALAERSEALGIGMAGEALERDLTPLNFHPTESR